MKDLIEKLNSMTDYEFFRFWMYILDVCGWILFFMTYLTSDDKQSF